ncbi:hypothetical protein GCM10025771_18640 [Niveibacterium umoris]|uniref:histidine kinase n=1 Tax=Niveibacterium umoris TaxID=1193620 RepID=A0A840BRC1_9RHOO|nr:PAS domain-containing sensor histidine kinase [Niveibacterium umoris]MBB4012947.1 signal transduction histidine kinase [Niveibacterium umoris]
MITLRRAASILLLAYGALALLTAAGSLVVPFMPTATLHPTAGCLAIAAAIAMTWGQRRTAPGRIAAAGVVVIAVLPLLPLWPHHDESTTRDLWPADVSALPASLLLLWAAAYLAQGIRTAPRVRAAVQIVASALGILALAGVLLGALSLPLIYGWHYLPAPPVPVSLALLLLAIELFVECYRLNDRSRGEEVRVTRIGIGFLIAVTLASTVITLVALQTQIERSLYQQQRMVARNREQVFFFAAERLYADAAALLKDAEIARLAAQAQRSNDEALRRKLFQRIQEQLPFRVVRAFRVEGRDGQLLTDRGTLSKAATIWADTRGKVQLELKWEEGIPFVLLRLQLDTPAEGQTGELQIEQSVPAWEQLVSDTYDLGRTGVMAVCGENAQHIRCFLSGAGETLRAPPAGSPLMSHVEAALAGRTSPDWDPLISADERGRPMTLVFGPIGRVGMAMGIAGNGLGMLVSQDAVEFYEPVRKQWHRILPVVLAIILVAGWALRRIVRPLISALRDKEARFRELTELSSDCYWQIDADLRFTEIVGKDLPGSGIETPTWLSHRLTELPLKPDDVIKARELEAKMGRRELFSEETLRITAGTGTHYYLVLSGAPQYDARGRFIGYRGVGRNITRQRQAEERLRHTQKDLLRAERLASLGSLVAGVAHELNTPIGNCVTAASALTEEVDRFDMAVAEGRVRRVDLSDFNAYVREATHLLKRGLDRAAGTITKFKEVAVDQSSDRRRSFDLQTKLNDIVGLLNPTLVRRGVRLDASVPGGIEMDSFPGAIAQAIDNLVLNALTHAFEGRERGDIHLMVTVQPDDRIRMTLRDNGQGMTAEVRERIFEPFFTTRLGTGGSGLGLYIVRNIVQEVLAGTIEVESSPGEGTTFTLEFPRVTPNTGAPPPEALR